MTTIVRTHRILIHAALQTVYNYVADLSRHPEWNGGLKIEAVAPGPVQVGKEYVSHGAVATQKNRPNTVKITEYAPPRLFGFVSQDPDFGKVFHVFNCTEQDGGILVTRTMTLSLRPPVALLFRLFIYPVVGRRAMSRSMSALKNKLEEAGQAKPLENLS